MKTYPGDISKDVLRLFASDIGASEFFSHAGNLVSVEQAVAVFGLLSPDFIERDDHVFWVPNANEYVPDKFPLVGLKRTATGDLEKSTAREDVERYRNNFCVSQFFSRWEGESRSAVTMVSLSDNDKFICDVFANEIEKYWGYALSKTFPGRRFLFEISDDLLDEFGVCLTFWQDLSG